MNIRKERKMKEEESVVSHMFSFWNELNLEVKS